MIHACRLVAAERECEAGPASPAAHPDPAPSRHALRLLEDP